MLTPGREDRRPLKVLVLYGTRPEAIKMAPVVAALRRLPDCFAVTVCTTGQHREMLDQVQELFGLEADIDLDLMLPRQTLNDLAARSFSALDRVVTEKSPDWLLVQGDTTTAMVGAVVGFHLGVRVGHVEAGLRTGDLAHPFPEEANRRIIDLLAHALFAPTDNARRLLLKEGVAADKVFVTGNTVVDALQWMAARLPQEPPKNEVLVTVHRRESFGHPLREILAALRELAFAFPAVRWIYPVHRNPNVWQVAHEHLAGVPNVVLSPPLDYLSLMRHLQTARFVLTDSGGIQEEAPSFGKPVLVLRENTERPEGVEAGVARLVGTERRGIVDAATQLLAHESADGCARAVNPYGDGRAAERIAAILAGQEFTPFKVNTADR